jgi:hypothetical protein
MFTVVGLLQVTVFGIMLWIMGLSVPLPQRPEAGLQTQNDMLCSVPNGKKPEANEIAPSVHEPIGTCVGKEPALLSEQHCLFVVSS